MGFQLADQFPGLDFYVEKRRLGIGGVPGIHFSDDFLTSLFEAVLVFHVLLCFFLGAFFSLRKDEAFMPLSCLAYALCLLAQSSPGFPHSTSFSALWPAPPCKKMTCTPLRGSFMTGDSCEILSSPEKARNDPAKPTRIVTGVRARPVN